MGNSHRCCLKNFEDHFARHLIATWKRKFIKILWGSCSFPTVSIRQTHQIHFVPWFFFNTSHIHHIQPTSNAGQVNDICCLLRRLPRRRHKTQVAAKHEKKWHQQQIDRVAKFLVLYTSFPTKIYPKISKIRIMNVWIKITLRNQKCTLHLRNWFFFNAEVHGTHNPSPGCHLFGTVRNQGGTTRCLDNSLMHHQSSLRSPFAASNCHLQGNQHNPKLTGKSCCQLNLVTCLALSYFNLGSSSGNQARTAKRSTGNTRKKLAPHFCYRIL